MKEKLKIKTNTYSSIFTSIAPDLVCFERHMHREGVMQETDCYPELFWGVVFGSGPADQVSTIVDGNLVSLAGSVCYFIPYCGIVEWRIFNTQMRFRAFICSSRPPVDLPKTSIVFPYTEMKQPSSISDLLHIIRQRRSEQVIQRATAPHPLTLKTQEKILASYDKSELSIHDLVNQWGKSPAQISRQFKADFGLSPREYRNKLRVMASLYHLIFHNTSVTDSGLDAGFGDLSNYIKRFKEVVGVAPGAFKE